MLLYDSTCACLILLYGEVIHADQGYTGTLEATPFAAREEGSGKDVLTVLGLCRNAGRANGIQLSCDLLN